MKIDDRFGDQAAAAMGPSIGAIRGGGPIVFLDCGRGCAELAASAQTMSAELMAYIVRYSAGFVRAAMPESDLRRLGIPPMCHVRADQVGLARHQMVAVDAASGITTGISAHDRAHTIRLLADPKTVPDDLARPGHVPTVLVRESLQPGAFEAEDAGVWLCRQADLGGGAVLSELVNDDDGAVMTVDQGWAFALAHGLIAVTVEAVATNRLWGEGVVPDRAALRADQTRPRSALAVG